MFMSLVKIDSGTAAVQENPSWEFLPSACQIEACSRYNSAGANHVRETSRNKHDHVLSSGRFKALEKIRK